MILSWRVERRDLFCVGLVALISLGGCTAADLQSRREFAKGLASAQGWQTRTIATEAFVLAAWFGPRRDTTALAIYIEGDGFAWATRYRPSTNPTPRQPVGLELALGHPGGNVAYLARPCQFVAEQDLRGCAPPVWTHQRFSEAVVAATDEAVSALKAEYAVDRVTLVGFSGGGAVATLVAARRRDVERLVTVAGVLDHLRWTETKHLSTLRGSLNPADVWARLSDLPQIHYVGANDRVVDASVAESFRARFADPERVRIIVMDGFDHRCCWSAAWPRLTAAWSSKREAS